MAAHAASYRPATQGPAAAASTPLVANSWERRCSLQRYNRHDSQREGHQCVSGERGHWTMSCIDFATVKCWSSKRGGTPPSPDSQMRAPQTWVSRVMRAPATHGTPPPRLLKNVKNRRLAEKSFATHVHPRHRRLALLAGKEERNKKRRRRRRRRR